MSIACSTYGPVRDRAQLGAFQWQIDIRFVRSN